MINLRNPRPIRRGVVLQVLVVILLAAGVMQASAAPQETSAAPPGCVQQSGVRVGPDQRYRRVVAD